MNKQWLRTDDMADIISSLVMFSVALDSIGKNVSAWKWAIITIHSALQSTIACHLRLIGSNLLVAKPEDAKDWLNAHDLGNHLPEIKMDYFPKLYEKLKHFEIFGYRFKPKRNQDSSIKKINCIRNDFVHFMMNSYSLEISGLPTICKDCLEVIKELNEQSLHDRWFDDSQHAIFRNLMDSCLEKVNHLEHNYSTNNFL